MISLSKGIIILNNRIMKILSKEFSKYNNVKLIIGLVIRRYFWVGLWGKLSLIALIEVIGHTLINLLKEKPFEFPNVLHLICWSVWLCACLYINHKQKL